MEIFNEEEHQIIIHSILVAERRTSGEIRLVVEPSHHNTDILDRASYYFEKLDMHKTKFRNGILIYLATDDHEFCVIGDAGIHSKVSEDFWITVRNHMSDYFKKGDFLNGVVAGIKEIGDQMNQYYPAIKDDINELPNDIYYGNSEA